MLKNFFATFIKTFTEESFYREVRSHSFGVALKYTLIFIFIVTFILSIGILGFFGWFLFGGMFSELSNNVRELYPQELVVQVTEGRVTINQEEPYAISIPESWRMKMKEREMKNMIVFDTQKTPSLELADEYSTFILVGHQTIGIWSNVGEFETRKIPNDINQTINEAWVGNAIERVQRKVVPLLFIVALLIVPTLLFTALFVGNMVYLLFGACIVWIIASSRGLSYRYGEAYVTSMYMVSLPHIVSAVFGFIPFSRTITLTVLAIILLTPKTIMIKNALQKEGMEASSQVA